MADLNVFQLTNQELKKSSETPKTAKKSMKESAPRRSKKARKPFNIPCNKIKLESLSRFLEAEDAEDSEVTSDYTPDDDVVLVIDPEMDEVPEDTEEAKEAAEDLVGQHVCKCAICGANYTTDADITEELEIEDTECPVCGETGDQIVVGVITPTEELSDEDEEDISGEDEDADGEDADFDDAEFDDADFEDEDDDDFEESVKRSRARTMRRKAESVRTRRPARKSAKRVPVKERKTVLNRKPTKATVSRKPASKMSESSYQFDEKSFNRMLTTFAKENYANVKFVRISSGSVRRGRLTLEGTVTTTKGNKRPIKFVCENFKPSSGRMSLKFKEYGPFTESVKTNKASFIVECFMTKGTIVPKILKYDYIAKENKNRYSVSGKVLSESVRRNRK